MTRLDSPAAALVRLLPLRDLLPMPGLPRLCVGVTRPRDEFLALKEAVRLCPSPPELGAPLVEFPAPELRRARMDGLGLLLLTPAPDSLVVGLDEPLTVPPEGRGESSVTLGVALSSLGSTVQTMRNLGTKRTS